MLLHIQKSLAGFSFFGKGVRTYVRTYSSQARSLLHVRAGIRPGTNLFNHPDICLLLSEGKRGDLHDDGAACDWLAVSKAPAHDRR
jgi:hypothetical protein